MATSQAVGRIRRAATGERLTRCRGIRDAAIRVLQRHDGMEMTEGRTPLRVMRADLGKLLMIFNTPFTPRPAPSGAAHYILAQASKRPMLPYALDIWSCRRKVFAVSWNGNDTELEVMTFTDGEWACSLVNQEVQP